MYESTVWQIIQGICVEGEHLELTCQEEASNDITVCSLDSDWAKGRACEVGVIKLRGEMKVKCFTLALYLSRERAVL
jgi:hypothetical protein